MQKIILIILTISPLLSCGQKYPELIYSPNGIAIDGFDPVAYFTEKKPMKGKNELTFEWQGATWRFSAEANRETFKANPEKYAPQYGGYCAWGLSEGYKAKVDPVNAWTVYNGRLYLNYNKEIQSKWLPSKDVLIETADNNWKKINK